MDETIDMADVHLFVAVARASSFVGASRRTGVPTSTVSRAVARLEQALGVRLLHRTSRRVSPTDEGAALLARAAPLLDELRQVIDEAGDRKGALSGRLKVTAPVMTGAESIGRALIAFAAAHPRVVVDLQLTNAVVDLVEAGVDLAFRAGPVADGDLVARRLWAVPYAIAASPSFVERALGGERSLSAEALARAPAVVTKAGAVFRFVGEGGRVTEVRPRAQFVVNDPRVAVEAARAGLGLVRTPRSLLGRERGELVPLVCEPGEPEGRDLYAVYPSRTLVPRRVRAAIEWVMREGNRPSR